MAKKAYNRWQGWPSRHSASNPDGKQRQCQGCRKPFVPRGEFDLKCPICRSKGRAAKGRQKAKSHVSAVDRHHLSTVSWPPGGSAHVRIALEPQGKGIKITWNEVPGAADATIAIYNGQGVRLARHQVPATARELRHGGLRVHVQPLLILMTFVTAQRETIAHARAQIMLSTSP